MNIQAIETRYKGYRFRSRLEARWAVTFDAMGFDWEYEPEGYVVDGRPYLPDFFIRDLNGFVEIKPVKPPTRSKPPFIYMAGKMGVGGGNWRGWRPETIPDAHIFDYEYDMKCPLIGVEIGPFDFVYTGPYGDEMGNHSWRHGLDSVWGAHETQVFRRAIQGIETADCVIAVVDCNDCYGTLVEIGYAFAKRKKLVLAVVSRNDDGKDELWFALEAASSIKWFGDYTGVLDWALTEAGALSLDAEEVGLVSVLAAATNTLGSVIYGTPGDHVVVGNLKLPLSDDALTRGRSARFEHGERG